MIPGRVDPCAGGRYDLHEDLREWAETHHADPEDLAARRHLTQATGPHAATGGVGPPSPTAPQRRNRPPDHPARGPLPCGPRAPNPEVNAVLMSTDCVPDTDWITHAYVWLTVAVGGDPYPLPPQIGQVVVLGLAGILGLLVLGLVVTLALVVTCSALSALYNRLPHRRRKARARARASEAEHDRRCRCGTDCRGWATCGEHHPERDCVHSRSGCLSETTRTVSTTAAATAATAPYTTGVSRRPAISDHLPPRPHPLTPPPNAAAAPPTARAPLRPGTTLSAPPETAGR